MRGYFLVAIILDHLNFFPNGLDWWSARGQLFVTTAEGFFFISGIVLGIVRGAKLLDQPFRHVSKLLLKRGFQLYVTTVILVLIFTLAGWLFFADAPGLKTGVMEPAWNIWDLIWKSVTLQYFYGWADYLRLYAIFLFVSPLVMWLLRAGKWYVVLAGSFLTWLLFPGGADVPDNIQELFQPLTWQLLFFGGMIIGFHWKQITAWWQRQTPRLREVMTWSTLGIASLTFALNVFIIFGPKIFGPDAFHLPNELAPYELYINYFDKERLPLARVAMFLVWFWAAFYLFRRFEAQIMRALGWLLLPFGTNSLYVYTVHAFLIFFVHIWFQKGDVLVNFVLSAAVILLIRVMIQYKVLMKVIPR
jgi:hypothetical protein